MKTEAILATLASDSVASFSLLAYMLLLLGISPFFTNWFPLGDFSLNAAEWYHAVMIPFALFLMIVSASVMRLSRKLRLALDASAYMVIFVTLLGLAFMSGPVGTVSEGVRDAWVFLLALAFDLALVLYPLRHRDRFKSIYGAYSLLLLASLSATLAGVYGLILAQGMFVGFSSVPQLQSYVTSLGINDTTFEANLVTSHSHEMLPAVMGGIVALTALSVGYEGLESRRRNLVNAGMLLSCLGIVTMSYLYFVSGLGTYSIPTLFPSGPGGMNGLALDDSQTGIVGWGALVSLVGLWPFLKKSSLRLASVMTWVFAMLSLIGVGYYIEFNESYYGFGSPGVPPAGGPGYLHDDAFMSGHLMFPFFMLPLMAGVLLYLDRYVPDGWKRSVSLVSLVGMVVGLVGLVEFVVTTNWYVEGVGLIIMGLAGALGTAAASKGALSNPAKGPDAELRG